MKSILRFVRATLTGGILFLLPAVLLIVMLSKAYAILLKISGPLTKKMPDIIFGFDGSNAVTIVLLILICFVSGLFFKSRWVRKGVGKLEENVLTFLPGYSLLKSVTSSAIGESSEESLKTVMINDGETWNIGFLVEEDGDLCTVFIPGAPRHDSGEVKIVPTSWIKKIDVASNVTAKSLKLFGKGATAWLRNS